ncbi:hypothetical protein CR513_60666, partial [Mucuna pruriens]
MASTSAVSMAMPLTYASQKRVVPSSDSFFKPLPLRSSKAVAASKPNGKFQVRASIKEKVVTGLTAAALTASIMVPDVAEAAVTPSLKNFLLSIAAGGVVVVAIIGAVIGKSGFMKSCVVEIEPIDFPLKSFTFPDLTAKTGKNPVSTISCSFCPSLLQNSPQSVSSILLPELSFRLKILRWVSIPFFLKMGTEGFTDVTTPITSRMELLSTFSMSLIGLKENCCLGIESSSSGQSSTVEKRSTTALKHVTRISPPSESRRSNEKTFPSPRALLYRRRSPLAVTLALMAHRP